MGVPILSLKVLRLPALAAQGQTRPYAAPGFKGPENQKDGGRNIEQDKDHEGGEKREASKGRPAIESKCLLADGHDIVEREDAEDDPEDPDPQGVRRRKTEERNEGRREEEEGNTQDAHINSEHQHADRTLSHGTPLFSVKFIRDLTEDASFYIAW